jgi:hypothetical protein
MVVGEAACRLHRPGTLGRGGHTSDRAAFRSPHEKEEMMKRFSALFLVALVAIVPALGFVPKAESVTVPEHFFVVGEAASLGFTATGSDASWSDFVFVGVDGNLFYRLREFDCSVGGCNTTTDTGYVLVLSKALKHFSNQSAQFVADGYNFNCNAFTGRSTDPDSGIWFVNDNCTLRVPSGDTLDGQGYHEKGKL